MADVGAATQRTGGYGYGMDHDEREQMEKKATTSGILNQVAREAHVLKDGEGIHIGGDDLTYDQVVEHQKDAHHLFDHMRKEATCEGAVDGTLHIFEHDDPRMGVAGPIMTAVGVEKMLLEHFHQDWVNGKERDVALRRDQMHFALLGTLQGLAPGYVEKEVAARSQAGSSSGKGGGYDIALGLKQHPEMLKLLQVRADEGIRKALDMPAGAELTSYLKAEGLNRRYHEDAAFRAGFDAGRWAKTQGEPRQLEYVKDSLHQRNKLEHLTQVYVPGRV